MFNKAQIIWMALIVPMVMAAGCSMGPFPDTIVQDTAMVPADGRIEMAVNAKGQLAEVEFHITQANVPTKVIEAVNARFPGGRIVDCEKEYDGGKLYYEVSKEIDGREYEMMVTCDGKPHRMEIAIATSDTPPAVLKAADRAIPGGTQTRVEKILDGNEKLLEYHIKKAVDGKHYKILVAPDGSLLQVFREVLAEIEVPVRHG